MRKSFWDLWRVGWHAGTPAKVLKNHQANVARTKLLSDKNPFLLSRKPLSMQVFYLNT